LELRSNAKEEDMPDDETREEPEVEGHGIPPGAAAGTTPGDAAAGTSPGVNDEDSDDVEAHALGVSPGGVSPGGVSPGGVSPGGVSPG
jgi:hypothetical protein